MSIIDLHMHSFYSDDGEYTPTQLVDMCHESGIQIMAIADHNWIKANNEASLRCKELGMTYIPAIEIDCTYKGVNLHVVGYGVDDSEEFNKLGESIEKQEQACSLKKLELTNDLGFELEKVQLDDLSYNSVYTGEMFGEALLNDPRYLDHELLKPYREGGARSDNPVVNFYWDYYAQGKPCYTEIKFPSLEDTIKLINEHGGIAVLAHPGNNLKGQFELLDEMVKLGLQGVECFSSYHPEEVNQYFYNKAKELNILYTCGSDFHGKTKPSIKLGGHHSQVEEEIKDNLKKCHLI